MSSPRTPLSYHPSYHCMWVGVGGGGLWVILPLCLSVCLSRCLFPSVPPPLTHAYQCRSSLTHTDLSLHSCGCVCVCVCVSACHSVFLSVSLSVSLSVCLSRCLSPSVPPPLTHTYQRRSSLSLTHLLSYTPSLSHTFFFSIYFSLSFFSLSLSVPRCTWCVCVSLSPSLHPSPRVPMSQPALSRLAHAP